MSRTLPWTESVLLSVSQSRQATARAPAYSARASGASNSASCSSTRTATRARRQTLMPIASGPSNQTPPRSPLAPAMRMAASSRRSAPSVPRGAGDEEAELVGQGGRTLLQRAGSRPDRRPDPLPNPSPLAGRGDRSPLHAPRGEGSQGISISGRWRGRRRRGGPGPSRGGRPAPGRRRRARRFQAASSLSAAARSLLGGGAVDVRRRSSPGRPAPARGRWPRVTVGLPACAARPAGSPPDGDHAVWSLALYDEHARLQRRHQRHVARAARRTRRARRARSPRRRRCRRARRAAW